VQVAGIAGLAPDSGVSGTIEAEQVEEGADEKGALLLPDPESSGSIAAVREMLVPTDENVADAPTTLGEAVPSAVAPSATPADNAPAVVPLTDMLPAAQLPAPVPQTCTPRAAERPAAATPAVNQPIVAPHVPPIGLVPPAAPAILPPLRTAVVGAAEAEGRGDRDEKLIKAETQIRTLRAELHIALAEKAALEERVARAETSTQGGGAGDACAARMAVEERLSAVETENMRLHCELQAMRAALLSTETTTAPPPPSEEVVAVVVTPRKFETWTCLKYCCSCLCFAFLRPLMLAVLWLLASLCAPCRWYQARRRAVDVFVSKAEYGGDAPSESP
jgi:hypothetical protein